MRNPNESAQCSRMMMHRQTEREKRKWKKESKRNETSAISVSLCFFLLPFMARKSDKQKINTHMSEFYFDFDTWLPIIVIVQIIIVSHLVQTALLSIRCDSRSIYFIRIFISLCRSHALCWRFSFVYVRAGFVYSHVLLAWNGWIAWNTILTMRRLIYSHGRWAHAYTFFAFCGHLFSRRLIL